MQVRMNRVRNKGLVKSILSTGCPDIIVVTRIRKNNIPANSEK
jgi:hypothetical protein